MRTAVLAAILLSTLAAEAKTARKPARNPGPPLVVQVTGPSRVAAGQEIEVRLRIRRALLSPETISLKIQVPEGAKRVSGAVEERIVDGRSATIERRLRLRLERVPSEDLLVAVDQRGDGFGVHAAGAYRFGRPEPKLPPLPRGKDLTVDGKRVPGRAVSLDGP